MAINETLKFSWGHIIAFVAIIIISYVSFMGLSYLTDGNFLLAGIGVIVVDMLLIVFFIGAQILKGTDEKFKRRIIFERILLFSAPFVFCAVMIPYSHFWTVFDRREKIESTFSSSLNSTKEMFGAYKSYAETRIKNYDAKLSKDKKLNTVSRKNKIQALRVQLLSDNFKNLKEQSCQWIDQAAGATVWNVFMLGNIHEIQEALRDWNSKLTSMSNKVLSDEPSGTNAFTSDDPSVAEARKNLSSLNELYTKRKAPTWIAILTGVFLMLMLLFPYVIQQRNTKSIYRLIGSEQDEFKQKERKTKKRIKKEHIEDSFELDSSETQNSGDYDSFSM